MAQDSPSQLDQNCDQKQIVDGQIHQKKAQVNLRGPAHGHDCQGVTAKTPNQITEENRQGPVDAPPDQQREKDCLQT